MEKSQVQKCILFVDIAGSTELYDTMGDQAAQSLIADAMSLLGEIVSQCSGVVIKTIGDEVMAAFDTADAGVEAAIFMQKYFQANALGEQVEAGAVKIKIGLNFGEVVEDQNDVFGNAVILASRLVAEAKPNQILSCEHTAGQLGESFRKQTRFIIRKQLKGLHDEVPIHEILTTDDNPNMTMISGEADQEEATKKDAQFLELTYQNQVFQVNAKNPVITMGRESNNHIVVASANISRQHAKIELKAGKYFLTDKSANGSFVLHGDGGMQKVHMESVTLFEDGVLILGHRENTAHSIKFEHKG